MNNFYLQVFLIIHLVVISGLGSNILDHPPVRAEEWIKRNGIDKWKSILSEDMD